MWRRLKRLWGSSRKEAGLSDDFEPALSRAEAGFHASSALAGAASIGSFGGDPFIERLQDLDVDLAAGQADERVVSKMRELLVAAPTDPRVLRRAAALLRGLEDEALAEAFEAGATSAHGAPLVVLARAFLDMDDAPLALALADGALGRDALAREGRAAAAHARSTVEALHVGACALAAMGEHERVLERLDGAMGPGTPDLALRYAQSALATDAPERAARARAYLGSVAQSLPIDASIARCEAFPPDLDGAEDAQQRLLFVLYGAVLLDDAAEGERLDPTRIGNWMRALGALLRDLGGDVRPAWISPRGEVLARWLAAQLPATCSAIPLSARLPKQPVLAVVVDDFELAQLWETRAFFDAPAGSCGAGGAGAGGAAKGSPIFQAIKDPSERGSPVADVIGVFRAGVQLPFEALDAERAADRTPPRMLAQSFMDAEARPDPDELEPFLAWARAREAMLSLAAPPEPGERLALDVDAAG